jgi:hypothetical protein
MSEEDVLVLYNRSFGDGAVNIEFGQICDRWYHKTRIYANPNRRWLYDPYAHMPGRFRVMYRLMMGDETEHGCEYSDDIDMRDFPIIRIDDNPELPTAKLYVPSSWDGGLFGHIVFGFFPNVNGLSDEFLSHNECMKSVTFLYPFPKLKLIDNFLIESKSITTIDLRAFSYVEEIECAFMDMSGIKNLDLSPLRRVTKIGDAFLSETKELVELSLTGLENVIFIGDQFLSYSNKLIKIDTSPLRSLKEIGGGFLEACTSLEHVNLAGLSSLEYISASFLRTTMIAEIDLRPLSKIKRIGDRFLDGCSKLKSIDLTPLSNVEEVGRYFLENCDHIEEIIYPKLNDPENPITKALFANRFLWNTARLLLEPPRSKT